MWSIWCYITYKSLHAYLWWYQIENVIRHQNVVHFLPRWRWLWNHVAIMPANDLWPSPSYRTLETSRKTAKLRVHLGFQQPQRTISRWWNLFELFSSSASIKNFHTPLSFTWNLALIFLNKKRWQQIRMTKQFSVFRSRRERQKEEACNRRKRLLRPEICLCRVGAVFCQLKGPTT